MKTSAAWMMVALLVSCSQVPAVFVDVAGQRFEVEVAATVDQQRLGLAGRSAVGEGTGMLFLFSSVGEQDREEPISMSMAGMLVDLDLAWIRDGEVIETLTVPACPREDPDLCPSWDAPGPVDALLEVPSSELTHITPNASITVISADGVVTPVGGVDE